MHDAGTPEGRGTNGSAISDNENTSISTVGAGVGGVDGSDSNSNSNSNSNSRTGKKEEREWRFIINVSAMEGRFYRFKTDKHPQTNMAKSALNMMTRTSGKDYRKSGIYMTSVDTG